MKAMRLLEYGGPLVLNDLPTPTIARDEIDGGPHLALEVSQSEKSPQS
jgi:hypothetical protein